MTDTKQLNDEELKQVSGGAQENNAATLIQGAIYKGSSIFVYVNGVYDNKAVSYYKANYADGIYKYGGIMQKTTVANFSNNFDVNNPITNVTVIKA